MSDTEPTHGPAGAEDDRPRTAIALGLEPHPEGGWFRRTWTADAIVQTPHGERPAATCIHYLLSYGEQSAWHVVASEEIWLWHGPGALELSLGGTADQPAPSEVVVLGADRASGHVAQGIVPAGTWQAARLVGGEEVLVTCIVSPGFSFDDWRLAVS